jgi:predicted ATPase
MHSTVPISGLFQLEGRHEVNSELLDELQASASSSLFTGAEERFAAARAISRLRQLTSQSWWDQKINE